MDGVAVKPLTVGFHETPFLTKLNQENQFGFWFQLSDKERQQAGSPWGPSNPQALNRYSYVQNNPLKWTDPTGHAISLSKADAENFLDLLNKIIPELEAARNSDVYGIQVTRGAMMALVGAVVAPALAAVLAVVDVFTDPAMNNDLVDTNGNLELLQTLQDLKNVTATFVDEGGSDDTLTIYMTVDREKRDTGPRRYVTNHRLNAVWGGEIRMSRLLDKTIGGWSNSTGLNTSSYSNNRGRR